MSFTASKLGWPRKKRAQTDGATATGLGWIPRRGPVEPEVSRETGDEGAAGPVSGAESGGSLDDVSTRGSNVSRETADREAHSGTSNTLDGSSPRTADDGDSTRFVSQSEPLNSPAASGNPTTVQASDDDVSVSGETGGAGQISAEVSVDSADTTGLAAATEPTNANPGVSRETLATAVAVETPEVAAIQSIARPASTRVMTVSNQKGGVGKTTTTVNLAAALAMAGLKVLVIDLDPQGNASTGLGIPHAIGTPSTYNVIVDQTPLREVAQIVDAPDVPPNRLFCVPATADLAGAEVELAGVMVGREFRLRQAINTFLSDNDGDERFDYVLIDCPPSLGLLTVNALAAASEVMIPVQCEYYALEGLGQLLETVELIKGYLNPTLEVSTMLLTMFDARTKLAGQVVDDVREHFGPVVMRTIIPRSVKVSEAPSYGLSVMSYDPGSRGAVAYAAAAEELAGRQ